MAKRTGNSSVNSSIRAGTSVQESGFTQLLELQKISNEHLGSIADALAPQEKKKVDKAIIEEETHSERIAKGQEQLVALAKENNARGAREAAGIAVIAQSMKTFKSLGDKLRDMKSAVGDKFGKGNIGRTALSAVNVGGILNKKIAQGDFIKQQKALGSTKTDKELKVDFAGAQKVSKSIKSNEADIDKFKKLAGGSAGPLTDEEMAKTEKGKELLVKKEALTQDYAKVDKRATFAKEETDKSKKSGEVAKKALGNKREIPIPIAIPPKESAEVAKEAITENRTSGVSEEDKAEATRKQDEQLFLLKQIVDNTASDEGTGKLKPIPASGEESGGLLGGIGSMGGALARLGKGAGSGLQGLLQGLAKGFAALANPATIIGMGAFTLAAIGIGKALELAAPAIAAFAPVLMKVAEVVGGVFIEAIKAIPEILRSIGDVIVNVVTSISDAITGIMDSIVTSIERLGAVDGSNLLAVGAGLVAVGAGMAAFGAGGAVAGVANLVTGFLGAATGKKTPIEQLEQIASLGPGLSQAGIGIEKLSAGLSSFGSTSGSKIAGMSEQAQAMKDKGAPTSNIVSAPTVNNNVKQTSVAKVMSNVRTHESSVDRYFNTRAVY